MKVTDDQIREICQTAQSMAAAAAALNIHFNTFKVRAKKLGVYKISENPQGKGTKKPKRYDGVNSIALEDILAGKHPQYQTNHLRKRLVESGIKLEKCEVCGILEWNGACLSFELDHIDGNRTNHRLENLRIICPNCHSQTHTYRGRNKNGRMLE